uniref:Uncharacterized protein n=1 Tax=Avena sativa TaxID=4498 RepID=A0ACD5VCZ8_AVESA
MKIQNSCLLTKFIHRLHTEPNSPWARWVLAAHFQDKDLGDRSAFQTRAWKQVSEFIDLYRSVTCVQLGDGVTTSLWKDKWTSNGPFCTQFAALFSHTNRPNISVAESWENGEWSLHLKHITSDQAELERITLISFLNECTLDPLTQDKRGWRFNPSVNFSVKNLYLICNWGFIWNSAAPKKGKIFAWLMIKGRIKVRAVLLKQNIVNSDLCPFGCQDKETVQHFVFHCRHSKLILDKLGIQMNGYVEPEDIYIEANKRLP